MEKDKKINGVRAKSKRMAEFMFWRAKNNMPPITKEEYQIIKNKI